MSLLCGCAGRRKQSKIAEELNGEIPGDREVYTQHVIRRKKSNLGVVCKAQNDLFGEYRRSRIEREISNRSLCQIKDDYDALTKNLSDMSKKFEEQQLELDKLKLENSKLKEEKVHSDVKHEITLKHEIGFREEKLKTKEEELRELKNRVSGNVCESPISSNGIIQLECCPSPTNEATKLDNPPNMNGYSFDTRECVNRSPSKVKPKRPTSFVGTGDIVNRELLSGNGQAETSVVSPTRLLYNRDSGEFVLVGPCKIQSEAEILRDSSPAKLVLSLSSPVTPQTQDTCNPTFNIDSTIPENLSCCEDEPEIWQKREELADDDLNLTDFSNVAPLPLSETDDDESQEVQINNSSRRKQNRGKKSCTSAPSSQLNLTGSPSPRSRLCSFEKYIIRNDSHRSGQRTHTTCSLDKGTSACFKKPNADYRTYSVDKNKQFHRELRDDAIRKDAPAVAPANVQSDGAAASSHPQAVFDTV